LYDVLAETSTPLSIHVLELIVYFYVNCEYHTQYFCGCEE
jgi:hypothetical protein